VRSSRTTGIPAAWASFRTSSQPSVTIGAITIASTFWLMKERTAAICAAGSLSAALKVRSKPFSWEKAVFIDSVFAERHPLSEPVWANPTLITSDAAEGAALPPASVVESEEQPAMVSDKAPIRTAPASMRLPMSDPP